MRAIRPIPKSARLILRRLLGALLLAGPFAAIVAMGLLVPSGTEAAILTAIGFSPVWIGMVALSLFLLRSPGG